MGANTVIRTKTMGAMGSVYTITLHINELGLRDATMMHCFAPPSQSFDALFAVYSDSLSNKHSFSFFARGAKQDIVNPKVRLQYSYISLPLSTRT